MKICNAVVDKFEQEYVRTCVHQKSLSRTITTINKCIRALSSTYFLYFQALLGDSQKHKYVMDLGEGEVIDASRKGSILRFVNHSCGPNAETQKWTVQGRRRIGLFAKDDITKGEEVWNCIDSFVLFSCLFTSFFLYSYVFEELFRCRVLLLYFFLFFLGWGGG